MATEKQANLAREKHSETLTGLGAHALLVDQVTHEGKKTFAVTAFVKKDDHKMPADLEISSGNKTYKVPLVVKVQEQFKPE